MTEEAGEERLVTQTEIADEAPQDLSLRPTAFTELVGQKQVVDNIKVFVAAAQQRGEALDHILLCGPPGLGKTTLAHIIAHALGVGLHTTSGPAVEKKDLAGILSNLQEGDVLFIDEIHRLQPVVEENLYPAMEDFKFDLVIGSGVAARSIPMPLPRFTLVGATTRTGLLTGPMRDRFGYVGRLQHYSVEELTQVVTRSADILSTQLVPKGAIEIAKRSRGTPRIANRLLRRLRDFAEVTGEGIIDLPLAQSALNRLGVDENGFDEMDRRLLDTLVIKFSGGPVGLDTLGAAMGEEADTIESVYEPYLIQQGYIQRTSRGRLATPRAFHLLGVPFSAPK